MKITLKDVYLLQRFHKQKTTYRLNEYQTEYFGKNYWERLKVLQENGYIQITSVSDSLFLLTVAELKDILRENGQKVSGKKQDLIERIQANIPDSVYEKSVPRAWYITEKGQKEIEENALYLINDEKHYGFLKTELELAKKEYIARNHCFIVSDVLWGLFNKRLIQYASQHAWSDLARNYYQMAEILVKENRREGAINLLLSARFLTYSGMRNDDNVESYSSLASGYWEDAELKMLSDALAESEHDIDYIDEIYYDAIRTMTNGLPFKYFSDEIVLKIIKNELAGYAFHPMEYEKIHNIPVENSPYYTYVDLTKPYTSTQEIIVNVGSNISQQQTRQSQSNTSGCGCLSVISIAVLVVVVSIMLLL